MSSVPDDISDCYIGGCDRGASQVYSRRFGFDSFVCDEHYTEMVASLRAVWCRVVEEVALVLWGVAVALYVVFGADGVGLMTFSGLVWGVWAVTRAIRWRFDRRVARTTVESVA